MRELSNTIQKALIFSRGAPLDVEGIVQAIGGRTPACTPAEGTSPDTLRAWARQLLTEENETANRFDQCIDTVAAILVSEAINLCGGNRSKAAKMLGLSRPTLHAKIEKYSLKLETVVKEP